MSMQMQAFYEPGDAVLNKWITKMKLQKKREREREIQRRKQTDNVKTKTE